MTGDSDSKLQVTKTPKIRRICPRQVASETALWENRNMIFGAKIFNRMPLGVVTKKLQVQEERVR